jgi:MoaD family protein
MVRLKVRVKYFAVVREIAGTGEESFELQESATVLDLLRLLTRKHGEKMGTYVFDTTTGSPRPILQFLVDDKPISTLQGFATTLSNGSALSILPTQGG